MLYAVIVRVLFSVMNQDYFCFKEINAVIAGGGMKQIVCIRGYNERGVITNK